ncbi:uncharacterized protein LOC125315313 [Rhodamnia argentea]|uniref:Uncharacterized protein LOC125315313 n=1 Tax=Rhodamnia argentea TaxID=178133 RepID=A0ABM3HGI5_9MYRT|nr:uncharacterized protein LOC125315313 [Rhodamnia argentea]
MSMDSVVSIGWDVLKWVVVPVKRQFGYVISSKSYAQDLQKEVGKLAYEAERIHNAVEVARNNIRTVYSLVTDWHESAEKALKEARELLEEFEKASKSCCYGTLPDPHCRYQFSRKAKDKIELLQRLARECSEFRDISSIDPAPGNVTAVSAPSTKDDVVFESRASIKRKIMAALADNRNSVVGVYGMGGIGKSTLLEEVERRIREDSDIKKEENVSLRAKLLHERLEDEERTKQENDEERKKKKKKKVLIILDNLWEPLDLKSVGIPCGHDNKVIGCQLLLTSRFRDVLQAEMGCDDPLLLEELQEEEARRLFESYVGDKVRDEEFKPLVEEALQKCAGLPFLIVQMAKLLKHANLSGWKNVLKQLKLSKNEGIGEKANKMLQLSYDHLKGEDVKSLLRLCVVCGVSKPSLENLVRYGVGLGLFREDKSMEEARESLASSIRTLQDSSLLLEDRDVHGFKIHDLVREFVASVASRDNPFLVLKEKDRLITEWSKDKLKSCRATCFPYVDMEELPEEIDCPEMQMFLLLTNNKPLDVPDSYFNSMRKLTVLNLTGIHLIHSPLSFQLLENLHTLCPDDCSVEDVASLGNLKGLQILSFANSKIHRLPKEIGQLVELRLLDLNHCSRLQVIEPGVLGSLIKLEELYVENSFDQWNAMEQTPPSNACLIELNNMKNLYSLHVSIPDPNVLPKDLNLQKLTKYGIRIGGTWHSSSEYKTSTALKLKLNPTNDILHKGCVRTILDKTDDLNLDGLNKPKSICELSLEGFPKLKHLHVENGPSVHYILQWPSSTYIGVIECDLMREIGEADEGGKVEYKKLFIRRGAPLSSSSENQAATQAVFFNGQQVSIPSLQTLTMSGLPNLETIWSEESAVELSNLQSLELLECKSLSKVFNFRSLVNSHKLHTLTIADCISVQEVFDLDGPSASGNVETPSELTTLELRDLPSLRCIWNKNPCGIVRFHCLTKLKVIGCHSLRFLFLASMVKSLAQLRELEVVYCKKMEAIIMEEEGLETETSGILAFPMLTYLRLSLESLTCFSRKKCSREARNQDYVKSRATALFNHEVAFPRLETLEIYDMHNIEMIWDNQAAADSFHNVKSLVVLGCDKLVNIVPSCIVGRLRNMESLDVYYCGSLEVVFELQSLNPLDGNPGVRSQLKKLVLHELPQLKSVWDKELHHQVKLQCLHSVTVSNCKSLTSLCPASVATDLIQLEELEISACGIIELIKMEGPVLGVVFPKLTSLKLEHLTELKCIYTGTNALGWPALKTLEVHGCNKVEILASQIENEMPLQKQPLFLFEKGAFPNLRELRLDLSGQMEIWHGDFHGEEFFCMLRVLELRHLSEEYAISMCLFIQSLTNLEKLVLCESHLEKLSRNVEAIEDPSHELLSSSSYFQHLKTLDVSHCDGLSSMFTPTMAKNLAELTELRIRNCKMLKEVISDDGGKEGYAVTFNQLKHIQLDGLTRLSCFSSSEYTLVFPLLEDVIVSGCPNMQSFSKGPIVAPKLERIQVETQADPKPQHEVWFWKENLNTTIQNMFEDMATIARVKFMWLSEFPELIGKWHSELNPIKSSWQLERLAVDNCPSFVNAIPSKLMLVLEKMTRLQVYNCESLEEIFNLEGLEPVEITRVLPELRDLGLVNLPKLRQLWNKDLQGTMRFNSLFSLTLYNCSNLRYAFTPSMARCLANLREIEIKQCGEMEEVIAEEEGHVSVVEKITFPMLYMMTLECLPNLTSFLSGKNHALDCPSLTVLTIAHCPEMRSLTWHSWMQVDQDTPSLFTPQVQFPQLEEIVLSHMDKLSKIWTRGPQGTFTFKYLHKVEARNRKNLEILFPHWVATSLTQLGKLRVESCGLEEIVSSASGDDSPHSIAAQFLFPVLTSLVLHDMPQLKSFCPNFLTLNWPFLKELQVTHCEKMNMLSFPARKDIPTLERHLLVDKDIQRIQNENLFDDIGKREALTLACFHHERAGFPSNFLLQIFPNLKSLEVFCSSFEDIFPDGGLVDEGKHPFDNIISNRDILSEFDGVSGEEFLRIGISSDGFSGRKFDASHTHDYNRM